MLVRTNEVKPIERSAGGVKRFVVWIMRLRVLWSKKQPICN